jgi:DNA-binding response OmpR family regulator
VSTPRYRRAVRTAEPRRRQAVALVVEDDPALNDSLCDALSDAGFECVQAFGAEEATEFLDSGETVGLFVIESMLPDTNGFQLNAIVKLRPDTNTAPVLMLLDRPIEKLHLDGLRVEPNRYVSKSVEADLLVSAAREELSRQRTRRREGTVFYAEVLFQSDLKQLDSLNTVLGRALKVVETDEIDEQKIKYATLEMGHNAIEWGNRNEPQRTVKVVLSVRKDQFSARIVDEGAGFDPTDLPHASDPDDPVAHLEVRHQMGIREGGFGILLAREFMDEVTYSERGNEVTLVKNLQGSGRSEKVPTSAVG